MKLGGTGLCAVAGWLAIALGVWMSLHLHQHWMAAELPHGVSKPVLAIELAATASEVKMMTGDSCGPNCQELEWQQGWLADRPFIFAYALYYLAIAAWFARRPRQWFTVTLGLLSLPLTLLGAYFDWREDNAIVAALQSLPSTSDAAAAQIRACALIKWQCLFAATGVLALGFLRDCSHSALTRVLGWITGLAALTTAYTGLAGVQYQEEARIEAGTADLAVVFLVSLIFFTTYQFLSKGTSRALDRLAHKKVFHWFTYWPDEWPKEQPPPARPAAQS